MVGVMVVRRQDSNQEGGRRGEEVGRDWLDSTMDNGKAGPAGQPRALDRVVDVLLLVPMQL